MLLDTINIKIVGRAGMFSLIAQRAMLPSVRGPDRG